MLFISLRSTQYVQVLNRQFKRAILVQLEACDWAEYTGRETVNLGVGEYREDRTTVRMDAPLFNQLAEQAGLTYSKVYLNLTTYYGYRKVEPFKLTGKCRKYLKIFSRLRILVTTRFGNV